VTNDCAVVLICGFI